VLGLLSAFGANLDEGMDRADGHLKADAFMKNANDVAIRIEQPLDRCTWLVPPARMC
jgi:hypothetical protein